jgi:signal transduction histidine kinase
VTRLAPRDIPDLETVTSTAELSRRASRAPDYAAENRALVALAKEMAVSPTDILQKLAEAALGLCHAHSAGISMLDDERKRFRWMAIAGQWAEHRGGGTPRNFSPSGTVLDRDAPLLFSHPERHYTYLAKVTPFIDEGLLIPFYLDGEGIATIWVIAHDESCRFDMEDLRVMTNLGKFAALAYQTLLSLNAKHAEAMRAARACQALVRADVNLAFATKGDLGATLQVCAESVVRQLDAAVVLIWTLDKDQGIFELRASAGMSTHLDGADSNVVGLVAAERKPLLINDLLDDPRLSDKAWTTSQGMVALAGYPLIAGDRVVGVVAMFSRSALTVNTIDALGFVADVIAQGIERKRTEDALRSTQAQLARVGRLTALAALSASIAHEVAQPLGAIITNGDACLRLLAPDTPNLGETRKALASMIRDGQRAMDVVDRVRLLLKKSDLEKISLDLGQVIREVLLLVEPEMTAQRIVLRTSLADDLPSVLGDGVQLQQVVLNLVSNSIEAMRDRADERRELKVSAHRHEEGGVAGVLVAVEDTGVGFEQIPAERLFEALYTTKPEGLGMGLSISRSIVETHRGRLWATQNAGHGATFQFLLPAGASPM